MVTTAAALDCVPDILDKTFTCYGAYEYGTEKVTCEKAHGTLTLKTALANSCNCSFAQIAELVGKKNMVKYVEQFGVTDSLSFDGVTTAEGNYDISNTAPVSFAWSCIGQHTDLINPARYMTFMGAIAGGGVGAEPYLVSEVRSGEEMTYEAKTKTTGRIMSQDVADQVRAYMRNNVQSVYGDWNFNGMNVCAKSGTSQLGGRTEIQRHVRGLRGGRAVPPGLHRGGGKRRLRQRHLRAGSEQGSRRLQVRPGRGIMSCGNP